MDVEASQKIVCVARPEGTFSLERNATLATQYTIVNHCRFPRKGNIFSLKNATTSTKVFMSTTIYNIEYNKIIFEQ